MRARRDGGPFACWYTSASLAKAFVPIAAPRRAAPFRTPQVLFTVGIEWRKGSLPGPPDRTSSLRDRGFRFCNVECPRLFYRSSSPEADCPSSVVGVRLDGYVVELSTTSPPQRPFDFSVETVSTTRPPAELTSANFERRYAKTAEVDQQKNRTQITFFSRECVHKVVHEFSTGRPRGLFWLGLGDVVVESDLSRLKYAFEF
jgi:hypothetical protein